MRKSLRLESLQLLHIDTEHAVGRYYAKLYIAADCVVSTSSTTESYTSQREEEICWNYCRQESVETMGKNGQ